MPEPRGCFVNCASMIMSPRAVNTILRDTATSKSAVHRSPCRIAALLRENGVADVAETYLNLEHDTRVRSNHFEVWFARQ